MWETSRNVDLKILSPREAHSFRKSDKMNIRTVLTSGLMAGTNLELQLFGRLRQEDFKAFLDDRMSWWSA